MPELREDIKSALQSLISRPLREASLALLSTLGYRSDRTLVLEGSKPQAFLDLIESQGGATKFDTEKACFADWKSADILFQLTDEDLAASSSLFKEADIKSGLLGFNSPIVAKFFSLAAILFGVNYPSPTPAVASAKRSWAGTSVPALVFYPPISTERTPVMNKDLIIKMQSQIMDVALGWHIAQLWC